MAHKDKYHKLKYAQILKIGTHYSVQARNEYGYLFNSPKMFKTKVGAINFVKKIKKEKYSKNLTPYRM